MQNQLIGWLGVVVFVVAVVAAVTADFLRQRSDAPVVTTGASAGEAPQAGGWVFWLTIVAVLLAILAAVATIMRLAAPFLI